MYQKVDFEVLQGNFIKFNPELLKPGKQVGQTRYQHDVSGNKSLIRSRRT